jgi:hypothetical protein
MDLKKIFSARVIGLIVLILVVLFIGAAFNANLEGMTETIVEGKTPNPVKEKMTPDPKKESFDKDNKMPDSK